MSGPLRIEYPGAYYHIMNRRRALQRNNRWTGPGLSTGSFPIVTLIVKSGATRRSRIGDLLITNCPQWQTEKEPEGKDS